MFTGICLFPRIFLLETIPNLTTTKCVSNCGQTKHHGLAKNCAVPLKLCWFLPERSWEYWAQNLYWSSCSLDEVSFNSPLKSSSHFAVRGISLIVNEMFDHNKPYYNHPRSPKPTSLKWMEMVISNHFLCKDHGNLRGPPKCYPPQEIRP